MRETVKGAEPQAMTRQSAARAEHGRDALCLGSLGCAFAVFAWRSWRTWPDILVDFGHELYIPWRLSEGDVLYRDIAFTMGPLSQYFNAMLFRMFGVSLSTLIGANLVILAAIVVMLYWLCRRCGTRGSATISALFFLAVFAFAQYSVIGNYNYVCPYRHEVTHGVALGLAELICLVRFGDTRSERWLIASGICLGLIALTKLEMLLPAVMTAGAAIVLIARGERHGVLDGGIGLVQPMTGCGKRVAARIVKCTSVLGGAAAAAVVIGLIGLARSLGWEGAWQGISVNWRLALDPALTVRSDFYRVLAGLDQPAGNIALMVLSAVEIFGALVAGYFFEVIFGSLSRAKVWAVVVGVTAALAGMRLVPFEEWAALPAALPLLLAIVIAVNIRRADCQLPSTVRAFPLCLAAIYAIGLLPKMLLHATWDHYGFALAMPATMVMVNLAVSALPLRLRGGNDSGTIFRALITGVLTACALAHVAKWDRIDQAKTQSVGHAADRFYAEPLFDDRVVPTVKTLDYLEQALRGDETLVVIPEGATLNYLLRKRNPSRFLIFSPWEFDAHGGEELVTRSLIASAPDYIVLVAEDMTIHGRGNFGNPRFGDGISEFLHKEYEGVQLQESTGPSGRSDASLFRAAVFKRRVGIE